MGINTIADGITADGKRVEEWTFNGIATGRKSPYDWPRTFCPSNNDKELWRAIWRSLLPPHANHRRLTQPLGPWLSNTDPYWKWWYSPSSDLLYYHPDDCLWQQWQKQESFDRYYFPTNAVPAPLPHDLVRADVQHLPDRASLNSTGPSHQPTPVHAQTNTSLSQILQTMDPSLKWAIDRANIPNEGATLAAALTSGESVAVSDASLKDGLGTAAFVLEHTPTLERAVGLNIVPGPIEDGDSYRCELAGLIGILAMVNAICQANQVTNGRLRIACDNISTLWALTKHFVPNPNQRSFDLVSCLHSLVVECPIQLDPQHVYGHQIDKKARSSLTREEQLNDEMDNLAKAY